MLSRGHTVVFAGVTLAVAAAFAADRAPAAKPGDRTISFYQTHTKERLTVTYKSDGKFIPSALAKLNWILRDWRKGEATEMDPNTIDLAWEIHNELGSREPINIISGYRSPATNAMLRKTRGGQAKKSQHMTGKAIDITFPDVPIKKLRYSALIRERGGVGYYPTSGVPFVHIDTGRVRAWPRLPKYELALLFPSGRTKHMAAEGGSISRSDVATARTKKSELAIQIAQFHADRRNPNARMTTVATLGLPTLVSAPSRAPRPDGNERIERKPFVVASLTPGPAAVDLPWLKGRDNSVQQRDTRFALPQKAERAAAKLTLASAGGKGSLPQLVSAPKLIERSSRFSLSPSSTDRERLRDLVQTASLSPMVPSFNPSGLTGRDSSNDSADKQGLTAAAASIDTTGGAAIPTPAMAESAAGPLGAMAGLGVRLAALSPDFSAIGITDMSPEEPGNGWVQAPEFDDDHPDELAYRPFPLAPLLTETASVHAPELVQMTHPDVTSTLRMLDDVGESIPMTLRPGPQVARLDSAQKFLGKAVHLDDMPAPPSLIANRAVSVAASTGVGR